MQRWHLTAGLATLTVVAAAVAPRLAGTPHETPRPVPPPPKPPVVEEVAAADGHLELEARLDRGAILQGRTEERFLAITISAPDDLGETFRHPVDIGVVMDASGSMSARGKVDYAKSAAKLLASNMESGDVYSLVTFSDDASVVIPATPVTDAHALHRAVDRILEGGGTNLYAGLDKGAGEVRRSLGDGHVGRVVLLSDGHANVGITDPDALGRYVATLASQGVTVSTVGLGLDYNEDLLARLADLGGGTYDFVDDPRELQAVFTDELERTASIVARSTVVTVELPLGVEPLEVIGWDATPTSNGWKVSLGDVYAGETRKIVARVRVQADALGEMPVASVGAAYHDVVDGTLGASSAEAAVDVTDQIAVVEASVNEETAIEAVRAWGNAFLVDSTRAYTQGDVREAQELARRSEVILREAAATYDEEALRDDADNSRVQQQVYGAYAPSSSDGKRAVKAAKEQFQVQSRSTLE